MAAELAGCKDIEIAYAEHPYVTAYLEGFKVDLVFCFDLSADHILKQGPLTAVDRTPHHSIFVDEHLSEEQRDDVRLLKAFLQTAFVYGDSSPVGRSGFTGFSSEMLIYHHNNFETAITTFTELLKQPLDYFQRSTSTLKSLFQRDLLIIVDPTDPARNVAASIDNRAFRYASHQANRLLLNPKPHFFLTRPIPVLSKHELDALEPNYFVFEFEDTTGWHYTKTRDKLYRYFTQLTRFLKKEATGELRFGETLFEAVFQQKRHALAFRVTQPKVSPTYLRIGPPSHLVNAVKRFREKHPDAKLRTGRYQARQKREFTTAKSAIEHYLKERPLPSKLNLISVTSKGKTRLGKQALWILTNAVFPFSEIYKNLM